MYSIILQIILEQLFITLYCRQLSADIKMKNNIFVSTEGLKANKICTQSFPPLFLFDHPFFYPLLAAMPLEAFIGTHPKNSYKPRTNEKLHCNEEPYRFSDQQDPLQKTHKHIRLLLYKDDTQCCYKFYRSNSRDLISLTGQRNELGSLVLSNQTQAIDILLRGCYNRFIVQKYKQTTTYLPKEDMYLPNFFKDLKLCRQEIISLNFAF